MSRKWESNVFTLRRPKWLEHPFRSNRRELDVHHVWKVGIKRFWAHEAEMTLTPISSLESGRKKFFYKLDVHHVLKMGIKRFWAQEAEMTLTPISSLESARKNFSWTRGTSCLESGNQTFLGSGGRDDSNTYQFARISEKKFFMNSTYIMSRK